MNKLVKKSDTRCRHNEAKYKIFHLLTHQRKFFLPRDMAKTTGLSEGDIRTRLSKMFKQGYLWRRICYKKGENGYVYRYLKPKGTKVYIELERRMEIRRVTGVNISLNWKKTVPWEVLNQYQRMIMR